MKRKKYKLQYSDSFIEDITEIAHYISYDLLNPVAADNLVNSVEKSIINRLQYPTGFKKCASRNSKEEVYYKIQVKNYTIFYVLIDDVMERRRIIYSRRDIENLV